MSPPALNPKVTAVPAVRVSVLGHFGNPASPIDGQIMRTRLVHQQFSERLGTESVTRVDTSRMKRAPLNTFVELGRCIRNSDHVVIMPASRGLTWLTPLYSYWKKKLGCRFHFFVVGGWLPEFLEQRPRLLQQVRSLGALYVQTKAMRMRLEQMGFPEVFLFPNFRDFPSMPWRHRQSGPLRLVYYSRVTESKGIELAIRAVNECRATVSLDVWGPIDPGYRARFEKLLSESPGWISYRGVLADDRIYQQLSKYDLLLFPTFYEGEGFPGAILDAFGSGLPVLASDWRYNNEFVEDGRHGFIVPVHNHQAIKERLDHLSERPDQLEAMSRAVLDSARPYHVDRVFPQVMTDMGLLAPVATQVSPPIPQGAEMDVNQ